MFSYAALDSGLVKLVAGKKGDYTEVTGSPEIVLEIISKSSEEKDTEWLMAAYFDAGIDEYWLIDARDEDDIQFNIYKRNKKEYVATRKQHGWVKSECVGQSVSTHPVRK